jgi:uroporphyrinogen decarboxylase
MTEMSTRERMLRTFEHKEADRVPITDSPWGSTLERWRREGLAADADWADYFELDRMGWIGADNSPRFPVATLEETEEYVIVKTAWGATQKNWKHHGGVPEFLDFTIRDRDSWEVAKARMTPERNRVDWAALARDYPKWRERGAWVWAGFWFGFDVAHSWAVGTQRVLEALVEDPEWMSEIFNHYLDVDLALFQMVWDAGYHFDAITWPDDMGFKGHQFFSLDMYRAVLKPVHRRAAQWAHDKGIKVEMHSCGDVRPFVPDLIEIGIDMLNPVEVKAGMDPAWLKATYGGRLCFHGGLNAALFTQPQQLWEQMRQVIPVMKKGGGYVLSSDHSVPDSVSLKEFGEFVRLAKELGTYA